jgi:lipopolysaccharide export system protein LptA
MLPAQQQGERKRVEILHTDFMKSLPFSDRKGNRLIGHVQLLHEEAVMTCDSAYFYSSNVVEAFGHVYIVKNSTRLYGDTLYYDGNTSLARVRGKLVRLEDSSAVLRTFNLDYNTKSNIGYFFNGGTLADKENVLESKKGYYYSDLKLAKFHGEVEMHNDTYDIHSDSLHYYTKTETAVFLNNTSIWHKDGYLSCKRGWYDRPRDYFHFAQDAYVLSEKQEMWADSIFYERPVEKSDLYRNIQMLDTTRSLLVFGDEAHLLGEQEATVTRNPSIAYYEEKEDSSHRVKRDTVFLRADTLKYMSLKNPAFYGTDDTLKTDTTATPQMALPPDSTAITSDRIAEVSDSIAIISDRIAEVSDSIAIISDRIAEVSDSIVIISDRIAIISDSVVVAPDTIAPPRLMPLSSNMILDSLQKDLRRLRSEVPKRTPSPAFSAMFARKPAADTSKTPPAPVIDSVLQYFYAYRAVKIYRADGQAVCDSMVFFVNDTLTEMYYSPVLWNTNNQVSADKMRFISRDSTLHRGEFLGSAFMVSEEDTVHYNQIKGRDMFAYFENNEIYLIDVMANVQTIFFMDEDSVLVNINFAESTNMKIFIKSRKVSRVKYLTQPKNDLHPIDDVPREKQRLKGFAWQDALRPKTRYEVCDRDIRPSQRAAVSAIAKPTFPITKKIDAVK